MVVVMLLTQLLALPKIDVEFDKHGLKISRAGLTFGPPIVLGMNGDLA